MPEGCTSFLVKLHFSSHVLVTGCHTYVNASSISLPLQRYNYVPVVLQYASTKQMQVNWAVCSTLRTQLVRSATISKYQVRIWGSQQACTSIFAIGMREIKAQLLLTKCYLEHSEEACQRKGPVMWCCDWAHLCCLLKSKKDDTHYWCN